MSYIDDTIDIAKTEDDLREVFELCKDGLEINFKKRKFLKRKNEFLGPGIKNLKTYLLPETIKVMIKYFKATGMFPWSSWLL